MGRIEHGEYMNTKLLFATAALLCGATAPAADANPFNGPSIGLEVGFEDYDGAEGWTYGLTAGWDWALNERWIVGAGGRYTIDGVEEREVEAQGGVIATSRIAIENQWGLSVRAGRVITDGVLLFGELGYEAFDIEAPSELLTNPCAPPASCVIASFDGSRDDEIITYGIGAEWAITEQLRLRGAYTYGEASDFERDRFTLSTAWQF